MKVGFGHRAMCYEGIWLGDWSVALYDEIVFLDLSLGSKVLNEVEGLQLRMTFAPNCHCESMGSNLLVEEIASPFQGSQ